LGVAAGGVAGAVSAAPSLGTREGHRHRADAAGRMGCNAQSLISSKTNTATTVPASGVDKIHNY